MREPTAKASTAKPASDAGPSPLAAPTPSLPTGGGAIRGIGEKFWLSFRLGGSAVARGPVVS